MCTITEAAVKTGFSTGTLRYYERIGLVKKPQRKPNGVRIYTKGDIQLLQALACLKEAGLSLDEISSFMKDNDWHELGFLDGDDISNRNKVSILETHLLKLEAEKQHLESAIALTQKKLAKYSKLFNEK
ncbi:MerR family transcriptional regulator [Terribacillus saccharophilus]|uniref:MerR family transcriptional regulator n=1 Tax=Terribacillus saccharophilus TaxID=361277 RepID=UPI002DCFF41A|nr:MerR family transcriptional regulator [Terribacillus saccharophilus]